MNKISLALAEVSTPPDNIVGDPDDERTLTLRRHDHTRILIVLVVFVLLSAAHTWPLASDPAHLSRNDNADAVLNT